MNLQILPGHLDRDPIHIYDRAGYDDTSYFCLAVILNTLFHFRDHSARTLVAVRLITELHPGCCIVEGDFDCK